MQIPNAAAKKIVAKDFRLLSNKSAAAPSYGSAGGFKYYFDYIILKLAL